MDRAVKVDKVSIFLVPHRHPRGQAGSRSCYSLLRMMRPLDTAVGSDRAWCRHSHPAGIGFDSPSDTQRWRLNPDQRCAVIT
jgi:hypothetical protein